MTRTAADIAKERGWGPGTVIQHGPGGSSFTITAIGREMVLVEDDGQLERPMATPFEDWREYDPDAELVGRILRMSPGMTGNLARRLLAPESIDPDDRFCPGCGNRVIGEGIQDREPGEPVCTPVTCDLWTITHEFDHDTREWVPINQE